MRPCSWASRTACLTASSVSEPRRVGGRRDTGSSGPDMKVYGSTAAALAPNSDSRARDSLERSER